MEFDNYYNEYFDYNTANSCKSFANYFKSFRDGSRAEAAFPTTPREEMSRLDDPVEIIKHVWHILCTTLPAVLWFALARVIIQRLSGRVRKKSLLHFSIEFAVIVVPLIVSINVVNEYVGFIVGFMALLAYYILWHTKCLKRARERSFMIGPRPQMLTLGRGTINILTAFCILAVDFESFPKHFRKTRRYGVGLMDTGIGLFVFAMGSVSKRPRQIQDFKQMLRIVVPLLVLGVLRTVVVMAIDYHQDEHEYGKHLNAFFTLGLTRFLGSLVSCVARTDAYLLPLGIAILAVHEICLQFGVAEFVMNDNIKRIDFFTANREGLLSLPGFVAIYVTSMYLGYIWQAKEVLSFKDFIGKVKQIAFISLGFWIYTIMSAFSVSIARVTCNFGYAVWILGTASLMVLLFMITFDLILNTFYPIETKRTVAYEDGGEGAHSESSLSGNSISTAPMMVEAVNMNGLLFFLVANILTGTVNLFLMPESRSHFEGYIILYIYMYLSTFVVYLLYRNNIRLG